MHGCWARVYTASKQKFCIKLIFIVIAVNNWHFYCATINEIITYMMCIFSLFLCLFFSLSLSCCLSFSPLLTFFISPLHSLPSFSFSLPAETFVSVDSDSIQVLLSFSLAHGGVNSILDCLQILLGELCTTIPAGSVHILLSLDAF